MARGRTDSSGGHGRWRAAAERDRLQDFTRFSLALHALLGPAAWITDPALFAGRDRDWLDRCGEPPLGVARPASTADVAAVVRLCAAHAVTLTPQGGNTGLAGGAVLGGIVLGGGRPGIILSLSRMNRVLGIDAAEFTAHVEAGVVLAALQDALAAQRLAFPLHLGSQGSAQVGGLIATNAGGSHALRWGMMGDLVLGLEAVLADGTVWDGARALLKDNAGYQLRRLFCGAEGTLGIVTGAVLRVVPQPLSHATALLAVPDLDAAREAGALVRRRAGEFVSALEFFGELGLSLAMKHVPGLVLPLETSGPVYVLAELSTAVEGLDLDAILEGALAPCFEAGLVADGVVAASLAQRAAFWRLREAMPEGQRLEGAQIKHDVSAPLGRLARFVADAAAAAERVLPGVRCNPFGHLGDGNVHFNLSPPEGIGGFGGREAELSDAIYDAVVRHGGSIAAEHGLGQSKVALADRLRPAPERALMRRLKAALDPQAILNPGKIVADPCGLPGQGGEPA